MALASFLGLGGTIAFQCVTGTMLPLSVLALVVSGDHSAVAGLSVGVEHRRHTRPWVFPERQQARCAQIFRFQP